MSKYAAAASAFSSLDESGGSADGNEVDICRDDDGAAAATDGGDGAATDGAAADGGDRAAGDGAAADGAAADATDGGEEVVPPKAYVVRRLRLLVAAMPRPRRGESLERRRRRPK